MVLNKFVKARKLVLGPIALPIVLLAVLIGIALEIKIKNACPPPKEEDIAVM